MTKEEAKKALNELYKYAEEAPNRHYKYIDEAYSLFSRYIPIEPYEEDGVYHCPQCDRTVEKGSYCFECNQRIDWEGISD